MESAVGTHAEFAHAKQYVDKLAAAAASAQAAVAPSSTRGGAASRLFSSSSALYKRLVTRKPSLAALQEPSEHGSMAKYSPLSAKAQAVRAAEFQQSLEALWEQQSLQSMHLSRQRTLKSDINL